MTNTRPAWEVLSEQIDRATPDEAMRFTQAVIGRQFARLRDRNAELDTALLAALALAQPGRLRSQAVECLQAPILKAISAGTSQVEVETKERWSK
jgi:hypothetical protein